ARDAGEVDVRKTVETERVAKTVPVSHEEVTVERRPVTGATPRGGKISEDEVRIPLSAEEAVVEKRTVPKEEVVIRKQTVQGEQKVEADLKRERVDVDKNANARKKH
ncbi:YsnF/AvaK domain-containing protein, partial [Lysobacter sp. D1-1-M9]|uniref:YsnF/AvaK domain-containing protein n=1 Tax=Novilysobacter longmucuonensis TaxID=3098603 RepID=UPI002FCB1252